MEEINNLVLEQLRAIRNDVAAFKRGTEDKLVEISMRMSSFERQLASMTRELSLIREDMAGSNDRLDRIEVRLLHIERRLELVDSE